MELLEVGFMELSYMQPEVAFTYWLFFAFGDTGPSTALMGKGGRPVNSF